MISYADPLEILCQDLQRRQLHALQQRVPSAYEGHQTRMASYTAQGLVTLRRIMTSTSIDQSKFEDCLALAKQDAQFAFLHDISTAAILSTARTRALERGIFGTSSDAVAELALLLSLFTNLLDGLVDEAPIFLIPDRELLYDIMVQQDWAETCTPPSYAPRQDRHPVVTLLYEVMFEIIRRIVQCKPWRDDSLLRERIASATRGAFVAESESVRCLLNETPPTDFDIYRRALQAKSVKWARVITLAPLCVRGWPTTLDADRYYQFIQQLGIYGGWIDDIADLALDLRQSRWSNVLLDLYTYLPWPPQRLHTDLRSTLLRALTFDYVTDRLVEMGGKLYDQLMWSLDQLSINSSDLILLFADLAQSWLDVEG